MADNVFNFLDDSTFGAEANEPAGKAPQTDEFSVAFQKLNQQSDFERQQASRPQSLTERFNAPVGPSTFTYTPEQTVDPYRYQKGFQGEFFNPLDSTNYQKFADRETFGSALSKGLDSFAYKFGNTFVDYWKGYGRMADALVHMDWDRMKPDEETLATQYYKDQLDMKRNFVFEQPENEDSIFSKRTMSEFIGNAGFALGTFAGLGIEIAADIAITAATGGAGAVSFGATAARLGAKQAAAQTAKSGFRFADALTDLAKGFSYGNKSIDEISAAAKVAGKIDETAALSNMGRSAVRESMSETFTVFSNNFFNIAKSKNLGEVATNLLKGTPLVGTGVRYGEKLAAASKAGASTGQMIGMGLQGLRRVAQELNMSSTEASFEAVTSYGDTLDKMVKQYQVDNDGAVPTAKEFEEMRSLAMQASTANYNTNLGLLLATNKLQFGNLFNRFIPANKFMTEAAENVMVVNSKAGKALIDKSGFFGSYGVLGKVAKEFGKKEAAWQFSKAFTKDFLKFEVSEGLQENLQETSATAWRDYYAGQFNGLETSLSDAFGKGVSEQFTKQGLKTFLMGAFTGSLIRVPTALASSSFEAANRALINREYAKTPELNPYKRAEEQFKKDLEIQNALFKQAKEGSFKEKIVNFVAQTDAAQQQAEAAAKGLRYEFENGRDNALLAAVASAQRTNSIGMLQRAIKDMGKDMTAEEFEKSFGVKLEDTKYKSASEFSESVARDVKKYSDVIDGLRTKFKSTMANPAQYDKGSRGQYVATLMRGAQEEAIQVLALNAIKGDMSANRAKQIAEELMSAPGIGTSADYALRALTNATSLQGEVKSLYAEIRILQEQLKAEGLDAETKNRIKEQLNSKIKEEELLSKWAGYREVRDSIIGYDKDNQPVKSKQIADVFVGKSIDKTQTVTDENGNEVETVDRTFDPTDPEVIETFRQLMNIKNKQAGNSTEISEEVMRDSFQKIYDYIRLDRDTKDYMRSVDVLMNPDNFRQMQERMVDGKFKFNLILYVDKLDDDLYNRTLEILNDLAPIEQDAVNIIEDLRSTLVDSENYKNLLVVIANPDMSIEQEDYAFKLYEGIVQDLLKKEAEIRVKYAPKEYTDDISQEDYDEIIATKELDPVIKYLIANKLSQGIALSEREEKVYNIHKDAIDKEVSPSKTPVTSGTSVDPAEQTLAVELPPIIIVGPDGEEVIEETPATAVSDIKAKKAYIEKKHTFTRDSLKEISDGTGLAKKGTVILNPDKVSSQLNVGDKITFYAERERTGVWDGKAIREDKSNNPFGILAVLSSIDAYIKNQSAIDAELSALEGSEPAPTTETFTDSVDDANLAFFGISTQTALTEQETALEQETPFAATGTEEQGYDVVDRNNNAVNPEKIPSAEQAVELAESMNTTRADLDFVQKLMGTTDTAMVTKALEIFQKSMEQYNKRKKTGFTTLEEYYKTPDGKRLIDANKEALITGKPVNYKQKPVAVAVSPVTSQITLFESPATGNVASLTLSSLESLHAKVKEFREQALQDPIKFSKFVETGNVPSAPITEASILNKLQDITRCFS